MDKNVFDAIFPLKVYSLVRLLREHKRLTLEDALRYLYSSREYALLEQEETKLWHYSPRMLLEMLFCEKKTGEVYFPNAV